MSHIVGIFVITHCEPYITTTICVFSSATNRPHHQCGTTYYMNSNEYRKAYKRFFFMKEEEKRLKTSIRCICREVFYAMNFSAIQSVLWGLKKGKYLVRHIQDNRSNPIEMEGMWQNWTHHGDAFELTISRRVVNWNIQSSKRH